MLKFILGILTTDFYKDEKYILSLREDSISLPSFEFTDYSNITNTIKDFISNNVFQDQKMTLQYINPRFISINDENISKLFPDTKDNLYFLYGCVGPKLLLHPSYYWKTFDVYDQTILTELKIINDIIEYTI